MKIRHFLWKFALPLNRFLRDNKRWSACFLLFGNLSSFYLNGKSDFIVSVFKTNRLRYKIQESCRLWMAHDCQQSSFQLIHSWIGFESALPVLLYLCGWQIYMHRYFHHLKTDKSGLFMTHPNKGLTANGPLSTLGITSQGFIAFGTFTPINNSISQSLTFKSMSCKCSHPLMASREITSFL